MLMNREEIPLSISCCIYKVPDEISEQNKDAYYSPKIVSIGPFHYGNPRLQNIERLKQILFARFKKRADPRFDDLVRFVKFKEPMVRDCYSENIKLSQNEFVKLILIDAGFIIELFRMCHVKDWLTDDAFLHFNPLSINNLPWDLILLENQLPFFMLEELFNWVFPRYLRGNLPSFLELTFKFFGEYNTQNLELNSDHFNINHFTDLIRAFHLPRHKPERQRFEWGGTHLAYTAYDLHEIGVKFKTGTSKCLLDFKFSGRVLEIPHILVEDKNEILLHNIIALEQCHYPDESYITDYALLMNCLINTSKDVDVLVHNEIIRNYLADNTNVTKVFNSLGENIVSLNFNSEYHDICKKLTTFCKHTWN